MFPVCQAATNVTAVIDFTKKISDPETQPQKFFNLKLIPYFRVDVPFDGYLRGVDALLHAANGSNGFMIFHSELGSWQISRFYKLTILKFKIPFFRREPWVKHCFRNYSNSLLVSKLSSPEKTDIGKV